MRSTRIRNIYESALGTSLLISSSNLPVVDLHAECIESGVIALRKDAG